jgi:hypothetical protein
MVQYTLAESPEIILTVPGRDSAKARAKAMDRLVELMDAGELPTKLADGFSPERFIEVKEPKIEPDPDEAVTEAVQILSSLVTLKEKLDSSRTEALKVRQQIDLLFEDEPISEEDIVSLKDGFKVLKSFAQANQRYKAAREQAQEARQILDRALNSSSGE